MKADPDALRLALYGDDLEDVCYQLQAGADANQILPGGSTPLLEAQTYELAATLIEHGASVRDVDRLGRNVFHNLAFADHPDRLAVLFSRLGADLEARDCDGKTPLLAVLAEYQALPEAAMTLMVLGAYPHVQDAQGNNALHCWAAGRANARVGMRILNADVDPAAKNKLGQTAFDILKAEGQCDKIEAIGVLGAIFNRGELELATPQATAASCARRV